MRIIINADDFGYSRAVNYGIIDAYKLGVLTSTTLMVTMEGLDHAIELYKDNPSLGLGLHLNIALGKPLTGGSSIVENGEFIKPKNYTDKTQFNEEEVYNEFRAQYDKFLAKVGKKPSHFDSHLFTSDCNEVVKKCAIKLAEEVNLPLRNHDTKGYEHVEFIQFRNFNETVGLDYLYRQFDNIIKFDCVEIMSHPAYIDNKLKESSSYNLQRLDELDVLLSEELKKLIKENNVELITYENIEKKDINCL
ncbi:carbohydrate deacetylase [Anaerorhabdus sp.]|uniref:carbohydrate deacetylase n=1 Tax=Anaerorhabdus sp. TaxID=1872524 RepID=UPI002FC78C0E